MAASHAPPPDPHHPSLLRELIDLARETIFSPSWAPWTRYVLLIILVAILAIAGRVILFGTPLLPRG